ncbi:uncharacterized protein N7515_004295 [Penicillium bovifimosum]|uniref:Uncharacterized protein n=1 Tax=Penicillium bovifimosum TaxID=126998 RepID=A0A9W9L3S5_9EURO|nr:uncharacterized protein N7515_004295 [Penicillium bovifimosum]KAJ5135017.1 hypothetical protein N7515_004295 [Penicillium bovifimosum]
MPAAIPPITGVRAPSVEGRVDPSGLIRSLDVRSGLLTWYMLLQMLRRGLVLDLSTAFATEWDTKIKQMIQMSISLFNGANHALLEGFGTTFGYLWWYGYHLPRVRERDTYYARLEAERAAQRG